ncbi:hypothetical protein OWR29_23795 [Actinoplanes sp. Pm04-4]|uniref:Uncharacterized protein n=1 Tax=Paractinoplanes pyxinae TaxID=2997416 RepID=A0ABT4B3F4_9ACTN|nr:hypothetical protein [Actinoplanes pyxinae]MCY1141032.1 hypothetical protein [Actinoplanes pyxinae]
MRFNRLAAAIACAITAGSSLVAAPASAAAKPGVVVNYWSTPVVVKVKPKKIEPFKDLYYTNIKWTKLTSSTGYATSIRHINSCEPSCADANYVTQKVSMKFTRVRTTSTKRRVFTQVRVTVLKTHKTETHALPLKG